MISSESARLGEHRRRRHARAGRVEAPGIASAPARSAGGGLLGERPLALGGDADRGDPVPVGIGGAKHVRGGDARHVVFGRLAAEQHDEMDATSSPAVVDHRPTVPSASVRIRASEAAAAIGGRLIGPDVEFDGASFDSRSTQPGQLFVPIVAERDGHEFIGAARDAGAPVHLTSAPDRHRRDGTAIVVADTALGAARPRGVGAVGASMREWSASPAASARRRRRT